MATIREVLAKALMTQVPVPRGWTRSLAADKRADEDTKNAPIFANYKAVTFPTLVGFVTGIWLGLRQTEAVWTTSRWVPLALCLIFGGGLTLLELSEDNLTPRPRKFWGGLVGLGNCFVLFSAVIGTTSFADGRAAAGAARDNHPPVSLPANPQAANEGRSR
jgi:hypothetical protein